MFSIKAKKNQKVKQEQQGRSMVEMLGVLAIIGILGMVAVLGYKIAMQKYQANQVLESANQYAALLFIWKKNHEIIEINDQNNDVPSIEKTDVKIINAAIDTPGIDEIQSNSVALTIHFNDENVCKSAASVLGGTCTIQTNPNTGTISSITHAFPQN